MTHSDYQQHCRVNIYLKEECVFAQPISPTDGFFFAAFYVAMTIHTCLILNKLCTCHFWFEIDINDEFFYMQIYKYMSHRLFVFWDKFKLEGHCTWRWLSINLIQDMNPPLFEPKTSYSPTRRYIVRYERARKRTKITQV